VLSTVSPFVSVSEHTAPIPSKFGVVRRWRHSCYATSEFQERFCYLL